MIYPVRTAACVFLAANLLHTADHQRRGTSGLTTEIFVGGTLLTASAFLMAWLAWRRHPRAPLFAVVIGLSDAAGVAASHLAPHWSAFSNPYPAIHPDALAWAAMLFEIGAALALAVAGALALRGSGAPSPQPG